MKKLAKKSAKPTIADMTPKQFEAALVRHGIAHDISFPDAAEYFVIAGNGGVLAMGKTRRAKLANLLALKDGFESEQEARAEADKFGPTDEPHLEELTPSQEFDKLMTENAGHEGAAIASLTPGFNISYGSTPVSGEAAVESTYMTSEAAEVGKIAEFAKANDISCHEAEKVMREDNRSGMEVAADKERFTSGAVANLFDRLEVRHGAVEAAKMLQNAVRDCGKKTVVDGKLGPYTLKLANKIAEFDLLKALQSRAVAGTEAK
jgi:lysozyme family protein